jgi:alpha-D-ribose 1-methylphosphonate 5-triphosphate synthase subunit PhnH
MYSSVYPTQKVFRVLVEAMSHPGLVYTLPAHHTTAPWTSSLLAVAHTLLDHEVTFAFIGENIRLAEEVYAATKARQVAIEEAHYIIIEGNRSSGQIATANCGSSAYPDQGATLIYALSEKDVRKQTPQLSDIVLSGPGIKEPLSPQLAGLSVEELSEIRQLNTEYPLGVDSIFLRGDNQLMCIPRSTKITVE